MKILISKERPSLGGKLSAWNCNGEEEKTSVLKNMDICIRLRDHNLLCYKGEGENGESYYIVLVTHRGRILVTRNLVIRGEKVAGIMIDASNNIIIPNFEIKLGSAKRIVSIEKTAEIVSNSESTRDLILQLY